MADFCILSECRLRNVRIEDVIRNNEKVGEKTVVDVLTWGDEITLDVDQNFAKELKTGVTGKATITGELTRSAEVVNYNDKKTGAPRQFAKSETGFTLCNLVGFEPSKI